MTIAVGLAPGRQDTVVEPTGAGEGDGLMAAPEEAGDGLASGERAGGDEGAALGEPATEAVDVDEQAASMATAITATARMHA